MENVTITSRNHTILHLVFLLSLLTQKENVLGSHSVQTEKGKGGSSEAEGSCNCLARDLTSRHPWPVTQSKSFTKSEASFPNFALEKAEAHGS